MLKSLKLYFMDGKTLLFIQPTMRVLNTEMGAPWLIVATGNIETGFRLSDIRQIDKEYEAQSTYNLEN